MPPGLLSALEREGAQFGVRIEEDEGGGKRARFSDDFRTYYPFFPGLIDLPARLERQDQMGIGRQVLSLWMDMVGYGLEPHHGQRLSRLANEAMADLVRQHPDRLLGMATVPLQDGALAAEEIRLAARDLGLRAVQIGTNVNGRNLDEPDLDQFWAACQNVGALVFIHPHRVTAIERLDKYFTMNVLGNPIETTIAASSLLFGGVLERYPELNVCLAHAGGFLPYQLGRLDHGYAVKSEARQRLSRPPSAYFDRFYFDTISHHDPALAYLLQLVGPKRLLFGTDAPFPMADEAMARRIAALPGLGDDQRGWIFSGNAARLLDG